MGTVKIAGDKIPQEKLESTRSPKYSLNSAHKQNQKKKTFFFFRDNGEITEAYYRQMKEQFWWCRMYKTQSKSYLRDIKFEITQSYMYARDN